MGEGNVNTDEIYIKAYDSKESFEWEKYALEQLKGTIAPELISANDKELIIIMKKIKFPKLNLCEIYKEGNSSIYKYGVALYNLKKTLAENGVAYYDWKNEHLFYDRENNKLYLIDYSEDPTQTTPDKNHKLLDKQFDFINKRQYISEKSFIEFKNKVNKERYYA